MIVVLVLLFLFAVIKKKRNRIFACNGTVHLRQRYCSLASAVLFKTEFLVELGIGILFPEGKGRSEQD